ncbi:hypothetical protein FQA47_001687 [Oryzias melastigma]|uniref:Uncharacterized protein n=1 Tax=Oryzias melastigma TaxID=30732 RepID=A0A834KYD1_ORYME|nr:hypothetical protein FQA47_001687 [Oryzias melastigma]
MRTAAAPCAALPVCSAAPRPLQTSTDGALTSAAWARLRTESRPMGARRKACSWQIRGLGFSRLRVIKSRQDAMQLPEPKKGGDSR